jgi:hypothetical protein
MSSHLLLPNKFKIIGWCLLISAIVIHIFFIINDYNYEWSYARVFALIADGPEFSKDRYFTTITTNITNTVVGATFIIGAMLAGFSKEKKEDEFISKLRLSSLLWAVWINYGLLFLAFLFVYGFSFISVTIYNMFTVLIIFLARFNYLLYKSSKTVSDEK